MSFSTPHHRFTLSPSNAFIRLCSSLVPFAEIYFLTWLVVVFVVLCLGFFKSVRVESQRNSFGFAVGVCLRRSEAEDGVMGGGSVRPPVGCAC
jgi:hypothetical protein